MSKLLYILISCFVFCSVVFADTENLDEYLLRKTRYTGQSSNFSKTYLEDGDYRWQSQTLYYVDVTTGKEVWILVHPPDRQAYYSKEYATDAWSHDGSIIGFWIPSADLTSDNPDGPNEDYQRWLVRTDGAYLKISEGLAHNAIPNGGFGWANTENAYYGFGEGKIAADSWDLTKNTINATNVVTGTNILDTDTATGGDNDKGFVGVNKSLIKRGIDAEDDYMLVYTGAERDFGRDGADPDTRGVMRIDLNQGVNPTITDYWGIYRGIPEYGDHLNLYEIKFHSGGYWGFGADLTYVVGMHGGSSHIFFRYLATGGSEADGGPDWEDWDGDSYGAEEVYPMTMGSDQTPECEGTYYSYWNHPSWDRWDDYMTEGEGDAGLGSPAPGTTVHKIAMADAEEGFDGSFGYINQYSNEYDGRHHVNNAWSDHTGYFPRYLADHTSINEYRILYGVQINYHDQTKETAYQVANVHYADFGDGNPYQGYPRPSQSPDGTKIAYSVVWLNNTDDDMGIAYAVAYYPYPPEITGASKSGSDVRIAWSWEEDSATKANRRTYSKRNWRATGNARLPREVKQYRVWGSTDNSAWVALGAVNYGTNTYDHTQTDDTTYYYAVTSIEHSTIESRSLSNTWKVTLSSGTITNGVGVGEEQSVYPSNPGADASFYTTNPDAPQNLTATHNGSGRYTVTFDEPGTTALVKGYHVYALDGSVPTAIQQRRIASIPVGADYDSNGAFTFIDAFGKTDGTTQYGITTFDIFMNGSAILTGESGTDATVLGLTISQK